MDIIAMLAKVMPILLLIIMGHVLQRRRFFQPDTIAELKKLVVNIALPSMLFLTFASTRLEGRYLLIIAAVFAVCLLMLGVGKLAGRLQKQSNPYYPALFSGFEAGMMGYSLFIAVFGSENVDQLAIIDIGQVIFVFFVLVSFLQHQGGRSASIGQLVVSFLKSPVILAILLGIAASLSGLGTMMKTNPAGETVLEWLRLLSTLTVPVIGLVIGYELHIDFRHLRRPLLTALMRLVFMMLFAWLINTLLIDGILHLARTFQIALYTMFLLPPPFVIPIYMTSPKEEHKQFILNTISVHIVLSLIAFVVMILVIR